MCEYKESGRPIYAYFAHMAASGGYYIGCAADYIMTNRNCTTGSIGVIMGPIYTLTGFFEKYGIESTSITAGKNKNMMNSIKILLIVLNCFLDIIFFFNYKNTYKKTYKKPFHKNLCRLWGWCNAIKTWQKPF